MSRVHLFEWEDQPWLPRALRDYITDHLRFTFASPRAENLRRAVADILLPPLRRSGSDRIVDVCSGGGGPLPALMPLLREGISSPLRATLTDLYPNVAAFRQAAAASNGEVSGEERSVSAFDVPAELGSFQTLFTAFHHFQPSDAKLVLADAAAKKRTLVVIEPFARRNTAVVGIGGFIRGIVLTPSVGKLTPARFLWTYPIPISAFILGWDGAVSCLRAYTADEMLALAREAVPDGYHWEAGVKPVPNSPIGLCITYLIGEPAAQR